MQYYTIGQIFKLGLIKNHLGKNYTTKTSVSKVLAQLEFTPQKTPFGMAKTYSEEQIAELGKRFE